MSDVVDVLRASGHRLLGLIGPLTDTELLRSAYPTEWSIADVLSHLGSDGDITKVRVEAAVAGTEADDAAVQQIRNEWATKSAGAQAIDALQADQALIARLESLTDEERNGFRSSIRSLELDFDLFIGLRLHEHAVHSWDIAVAMDPAATIPPAAADKVIDSLGMIVGFAAKPTGVDRTFVIDTTDPSHHLQLQVFPEGAALRQIDPAVGADITLPAESLIRLVYGRLDFQNTPPITGSHTDLDELRRVFPGF